MSLVWVTLVLADHISQHYKTKDESTMRNMPFPPDWPAVKQNGFILYYNFSQFIATSAILLNHKQYTLLLSAFPIQLAAFLMTCVRKSIITSKGWHYWYMLSLILALTTTVDNLQEFGESSLFGMVLYCMRHYGRMNKYVLWGTVSAVAPFMVEMT